MEFTMQTKICPKCNIEKSVEDFGVDNHHVFTKGNIRRNFKPKDGYRFYCKKCVAEQAKVFRQNYKNKTGNGDYRGSGKIVKIPKEDRLLMSVIRRRVADAKQNIRRTKRPFDIDADYMYALWKEQKGLCYLTNQPMLIEGDTNYRLSIDKIIPELGYVKGNVKWTIFCANRAKGDLSLPDLVKLCKLIIERATTIENTEKSGSE